MHIALVGAELEENLAIRSLAAAAEREGHTASIVRFDGAAQTDTAAAAINESGASLVGLSMVFTHRAKEFAALAERLRAIGCAAHITAGGHFAAFNADGLLEAVAAIDSVVIGEGEIPLVRLASALGSARLEGVPGLVVRGGRTAGAGVVDLDTLPPPVHRRPFDGYLGLSIVNMLSSRGCEHACSFCSIAAWHRLCGGPRHRVRSVHTVADEMAVLYRDGARIFNFHDDHFLLESESESIARACALRQALDDRGVGRIALAIKARPDRLTGPILDALERLGVFRVFVGIEAGTEESLRRLGRGQHLADNERALAMLRERDLHAAYNLLLFNPESTLDDVVGNVRFLARHADFPANFCRTEVYAGTPLEARLRKQGRLLGDLWGWYYEMSDPRAEALFSVTRTPFARRNFHLLGLHQLAMRIDYERRLHAHFWGPSASLRSRVKEVVRAINLDTAEHLIWASERIRALGPAGAKAISGDLAERVAGSDALLLARVNVALDAIHAAARRPSVNRPLARTIAVGVAATLTLAAAPGCGGSTTHSSEMAPPPTDGGGGQGGTGGTYYSEMAPPPTGGNGGGTGGTYYSEMAPPPTDAGTGGTYCCEFAPPPVDAGRDVAGDAPKDAPDDGKHE
jgi:anaerobic magnesium-protoporphyrin IX monomethyl ester cyclase